MSYNSNKREFRIYSEDPNLVGVHDITITSFLTDYPSIKSLPTSSTLEVFDACPDPHSVVAPEQTNPADYYFSGNSPSLTFTLTPF